MYAHVNIWQVNETGASADDTVARELVDRLRRQPGFRSYTLVQTGEREVVAVTVFDSREQLERAVESVADFVQQRVVPLAAGAPQRRRGEVRYYATA
jgi:heme-degrading monooxygenase HmoA